MSVQSVRGLFREAGLEELVLYSVQTSDTVEHAAALLGCLPAQIAKTMSLLVDGGAVVLVASGDARIDNPKYKAAFGAKAKLIPYDEVEAWTGHLPGGICPFALREGVQVYLDVSLRRFETVYTGGGDEHNTVRVTLPQLEQLSRCTRWVDVCKGWQG